MLTVKNVERVCRFGVTGHDVLDTLLISYINTTVLGTNHTDNRFNDMLQCIILSTNILIPSYKHIFFIISGW